MKMKLRLKQMIAGSVLAWLALAPPGFAAFQIIGDDICVVASEYKKFEAEIERARKGDLSRSNSTLVNPRKNRPPIKEKYSTQVSLTKDSGGNAHVAAVALVSDDGCDVRVNGEQWLKESGKGHDISRGLRRYGKLLLPGDENRFDIEYSQTFYDPAVLENDLDGLTMVVLPIEIDISVKDSRGNVNDRILVKKGETIDVAINPAFWEHDLPGNNNIEWEIGRLNSSGTVTTWWSCIETGSKISLRMNHSGIFKLRAKINGLYFYYRRHQDVSVPDHADVKIYEKAPGSLLTGGFDFIGVCESDFQRRIVLSAYEYCKHESTLFAKASPIDLIPYEGTKIPNGFRNASKCNLFVFVVSYESGAKIKMLERGIWDTYYSPPTVSEWKSSAFVIDTNPKPNWEFFAGGNPVPGTVVASGGHMGILDYDGFWIHANSYYVCKTIQLGFVGRPVQMLRERK